MIASFRIAAMLLAAGFGGLIAGCVAPNYQQPVPREVSPAPVVGADTRDAVQTPSAQWIAQKYTDLPIPKDFKLVPEKSFVFMQGAERRADLSYKGALPLRDLIQFYQDSMPSSGWRFLRMTGVRIKSLTYVKGRDVAEIIMESHVPRSDYGGEHEETQRIETHMHIQLNQN